MELSQQEYEKLRRSGLSLDEAFYLWSLVYSKGLQIPISHDSRQKLTKLGFLNADQPTQDVVNFFALLNGESLPEATRFEEFFNIFPLTDEFPPVYVPAKPRPIRIKRGVTETHYRQRLAEGISEEELIRAAGNYREFLIKTNKGPSPFQYMKSPANFLSTGYFKPFIHTSRPAYNELKWFKENKSSWTNNEK